MPFDVSAFMQQAQKESSENNGGGGKYPYRVVFIKPHIQGEMSNLSVRILPNNLSSQVAYKYWIHKISKDKTMDCGYNHYPHDNCPICAACNEVKNVTGTTPKASITGRAIMLAQYYGSAGYQFNDNPPKQGEIIIVMGPQSLYSSVNNMMLSMGPDGITRILTENSGAIINISRDSQNKIVITPTYTAMASCSSQEEFDAMLEGLPDIRYLVHSKELTQQENAEMIEVANSIRKTINTQPVQSGSPVNPSMPVNNYGVQQPTPTNPQNFYNPQMQQPLQATQQQQVQPVAQQPQPQQLNQIPQVQQVDPRSSAHFTEDFVTIESDQLPWDQAAMSQQNYVQPSQQPVVQQPVQQVNPVQTPQAPMSNAAQPQQSNDALVSYDSSGIPSNCTKQYQAISPACLMCIQAMNCPYNK